jgi:hypothetical protein
MEFLFAFFGVFSGVLADNPAPTDGSISSTPIGISSTPIGISSTPIG